ncbi:MAG: anaerobic ribonucleoside-triphosphate reductase activating protein [Clostridia bacterium]|nr:anaerobic ribonucleoside-triphosphate reductase activating protein [Clostridia bacterium]
MHYATIKTCDIANGPGVRTSLFVSGCTHRCPGCFNEIAWDFTYGETFTEDVAQSIMDSVKPGYIKGITLLGGEPMEPENQHGLLPFLHTFRENCPGKSVWCYSGYTWEQLTGRTSGRCRCDVTDDMLSLIDVLVDGPFIQAEHDITLRFRGSRNQRIIDVKKSLAAGEVVLWQDESIYATHSL